MGQEDAENKISFECLRTMVDEAIKTKNICIIERIEKENLRYAQKYAELRVSKNESRISFNSYLIGMDSVVFAILGIGLSYLLLIASKTPTLEAMYAIFGFALAFGGIRLLLWEKPKQIKEFENKNKDIEFMHEIILKIEERLSNRT